MIDFGDQIRRIAEKKGVEAEEIVKGLYGDAVLDVVSTTPVDSGFAKGSWVPSINAASSDLPQEEDPNGNIINQKLESVKSQFKNGDTLFLVSNAPYMEKLEYGGYSQGPNSTDKTTSNGYSTQAPNGMVRLAVRQILKKVRS